MTGFSFFVIFALFLVQATCSNSRWCKPSECEVRLRLEAGWVGGRVRRAENGAKYASFRGVPYGKPPLGTRRFKELEPVEPWGDKKILDATEDAPACPQTDFFYGRIPLLINGMSEDCIYLNLHVPYRLPIFPFPAYSRGLPILVFIHGGAFQSGSGLTDNLGPEYMMTRNVIVITFGYRLNIFGFLSLNSKEIPGNQGLRDQVTLLRWVQRNARAFGGDPENVTLMGQSSGATSAHILSLSEVTNGLFKKIILMSGVAISAYYTTSPDYAKDISQMFLQQLGINQTDPVLIHHELTKISLLRIMEANKFVQYNTAVVSFGPVVESEFSGVTRVLDEDPLTLIAKGRGREYPVIVSFTDNEMSFAKWLVLRKSLLYLLKEDPTAIIPPRLLYTLPTDELKEIANTIGDRYFNGGNATMEGILNYFTDSFFKHPAFKMAEWRASGGGAPLFMFQFAYELVFSPVKYGNWIDYSGAAHMDDLDCIFRVNSILDNCPPSAKHKDVYMINWMVYLINNFMTCSNPLCNNPKWSPVSKDRLKYNLIKEPITVQMMEPTDAEKEIVEFFDSLDPQIRYISAFLERQYKTFQ